ncbi:MAG: hypothetical protein JO360_03325 [Acidobacteria bacterium]|nr:hypothetical protein [Acidobacteriota bacterium]
MAEESILTIMTGETPSGFKDTGDTAIHRPTAVLPKTYRDCLLSSMDGGPGKSELLHERRALSTQKAVPPGLQKNQVFTIKSKKLLSLHHITFT